MRKTESDPLASWLDALESRHLADLTVTEVTRGVRALSSLYVERRERLASGAALSGAGKRGAFALYFSPLHFLVTREVVRALGAATPAPDTVVDLGCGTAVAGAAWSLEAGGGCPVRGVDRSGWAIDEARFNLSRLGLPGRVVRGDLARARMPGPDGAVVAAFAVNELDDETRDALLPRLVSAGSRGVRVLVLEAISRRATSWWESWSAAFRDAGGRDDSWRFPVALPETLARFDRASGLDHRELTAKTLWLGPAPRC